MPVAPRREDDDAAGAVDSALVQVRLCYDLFSIIIVCQLSSFRSLLAWAPRRMRGAAVEAS